MPHTLILSAAGRSTRFPNRRPKWSLTHPSGNLMAVESIRGISGFSRLVVAMNSDHIERFGQDNIEEEFELGATAAEVVNVGHTDSQTETVHRALRLANVNGSFTVKDCDNTFHYSCAQKTSEVAVVSLQDYTLPVVAKNKSYVDTNERDDSINACLEKEVISHQFCCGAYTFKSIDLWNGMFNGLEHKFVSQVVNDLVVARWDNFYAHRVKDYYDWGTEDDWNRYCSEFVTLFVDIDGVLCESSHRSFEPRWGSTPLIQANVDALNNLTNAHVILTTSRSSAYRDITEKQLETVRYNKLIMDLPACRRVLVNDRVGRETASAVNIIRNTSDLRSLL